MTSNYYFSKLTLWIWWFQSKCGHLKFFLKRLQFPFSSPQCLVLVLRREVIIALHDCKSGKAFPSQRVHPNHCLMAWGLRLQMEMGAWVGNLKTELRKKHYLFLHLQYKNDIPPTYESLGKSRAVAVIAKTSIISKQKSKCKKIYILNINNCMVYFSE